MKYYINCYADLVYYFATTCPNVEQYNKAIKRLNKLAKKDK